eukprot:211630_1
MDLFEVSKANSVAIVVNTHKLFSHIRYLMPVLSEFIEYLDYITIFELVEAYPVIKRTVSKIMDNLLSKTVNYYNYEQLRQYIRFCDNTLCGHGSYEPRYNKIFVCNWSIENNSNENIQKHLMKQIIIDSSIKECVFDWNYCFLSTQIYQINNNNNKQNGFVKWFEFNHNHSTIPNYIKNQNKYQFIASISKFSITKMNSLLYKSFGIILSDPNNFKKFLFLNLWNDKNFRFVVVEYKYECIDCQQKKEIETNTNNDDNDNKQQGSDEEQGGLDDDWDYFHGFFIYFIRLDNLSNVVKIHSGPLHKCDTC